jgi:hypothetical protein
MITVRVLDGRNGNPYARFPVCIFFKRSKGRSGFKSLAEARANDAGSACGKTDGKGEVRFTLPVPLPEELDINPTPFACGSGIFDTRDVLEKGVVGANGCKGKLRKMNVKFQARPGEAIIFAAPIGFWEQLFRCALRETAGAAYVPTLFVGMCAPLGNASPHWWRL